MTPFLWLIGVVLLYVDLALAAGLVALGIRTRSPWPIASAVAGILVGLAAALLSPAAVPSLLVGTAIGGAVVFVGHVACKRIPTTWQIRRAQQETRRQAVLHLVLISGSLIFLVPFAWLVVTSLKEDEDMSQFPPVWIPRQQVMIEINGKQAGLATVPVAGVTAKVAVVSEKEIGTCVLQVLEPAGMKGRILEVPRSTITKIKKFGPVWKNYPDALKFLPQETKSGMVFVGNTLILCALTIIGTLLSCSLVAYSFARLRWPGRDLMFMVLLATMMLPGAVTMMPVFLIFRWLGWIDTLQPLWVPAFLGGAFNIFLLRQFFMTIPNDLEDAAKIDGCSYLTIYWRIMLPLIKPALAAITILTFMGSWNNFMGPLIYISSPLRMPLAYALQLFQTAHGGEPGLLMAASTMMMLPVLLIFFFTQRYFIEGVTLTGIKG